MSRAGCVDQFPVVRIADVLNPHTPGAEELAASERAEGRGLGLSVSRVAGLIETAFNRVFRGIDGG